MAAIRHIGITTNAEVLTDETHAADVRSVPRRRIWTVVRGVARSTAPQRVVV